MLPHTQAAVGLGVDVRVQVAETDHVHPVARPAVRARISAQIAAEDQSLLIAQCQHPPDHLAQPCFHLAQPAQVRAVLVQPPGGDQQRRVGVQVQVAPVSVAAAIQQRPFQRKAFQVCRVQPTGQFLGAAHDLAGAGLGEVAVDRGGVVGEPAVLWAEAGEDAAPMPRQPFRQFSQPHSGGERHRPGTAASIQLSRAGSSRLHPARGARL